MEIKALSVSEVSTYVTQIFDAEEMLHDICIFGEVTGFSIVRGNAYFSLKDDNAILSCICFGADRYSNVKNGDQVLLTGSIRYYAKGGKLNFYTTNIVPYGLGAIYQQFLMLKDKLEKEGLFGKSHKKPLPQIIKTIGVVTSKTGAVIQDIINVSTRRNPSINIELFPAKVQGDGAAKTIIDGILYFDKRPEVDVIIVARGGGSYEDLQPFNDEKLARVVYDCNKPIISAVGHETDFTIIDFVADLRAPTPSAAAEIVTIDIVSEINKVKKDGIRLFSAIKNLLQSKSGELYDNYDRMLSVLQDTISSKTTNLKVFATKLGLLSQNPYLEKLNNVNLKLNSLNNLNPAKILMKGYSQVYKDGMVVASKKQLKINDNVEIAFFDGKVKSTIKEV